LPFKARLIFEIVCRLVLLLMMLATPAAPRLIDEALFVLNV